MLLKMDKRSVSIFVKGTTTTIQENNVFLVSDTGKLGECPYQESNLRPSDYKFGRSTTELQETRGS